MKTYQNVYTELVCELIVQCEECFYIIVFKAVEKKVYPNFSYILFCTSSCNTYLMFIKGLFKRIKEHPKISSLTKLHLYVEMGVLLPTPEIVHHIWMLCQARYTLDLTHISISIFSTVKLPFTHFHSTKCTTSSISCFVHLPVGCIIFLYVSKENGPQATQLR